MMHQRHSYYSSHQNTKSYSYTKKQQQSLHRRRLILPQSLISLFNKRTQSAFRQLCLLERPLRSHRIVYPQHSAQQRRKQQHSLDKLLWSQGYQLQAARIMGNILLTKYQAAIIQGFCYIRNTVCRHKQLSDSEISQQRRRLQLASLKSVLTLSAECDKTVYSFVQGRDCCQKPVCPASLYFLCTAYKTLERKTKKQAFQKILGLFGPKRVIMNQILDRLRAREANPLTTNSNQKNQRIQEVKQRLQAEDWWEIPEQSIEYYVTESKEEASLSQKSTKRIAHYKDLFRDTTERILQSSEENRVNKAKTMIATNKSQAKKESEEKPESKKQGNKHIDKNPSRNTPSNKNKIIQTRVIKMNKNQRNSSGLLDIESAKKRKSSQKSTQLNTKKTNNQQSSQRKDKNSSLIKQINEQNTGFFQKPQPASLTNFQKQSSSSQSNQNILSQNYWGNPSHVQEKSRIEESTTFDIKDSSTMSAPYIFTKPRIPKPRPILINPRIQQYKQQNMLSRQLIKEEKKQDYSISRAQVPRDSSLFTSPEIYKIMYSSHTPYSGGSHKNIPESSTAFMTPPAAESKTLFRESTATAKNNSVYPYQQFGGRLSLPNGQWGQTFQHTAPLSQFPTYNSANCFYPATITPHPSITGSHAHTSCCSINNPQFHNQCPHCVSHHQPMHPHFFHSMQPAIQSCCSCQSCGINLNLGSPACCGGPYYQHHNLRPTTHHHITITTTPQLSSTCYCSWHQRCNKSMIN